MRHAAIILREEAIMLLCNQSDARTHPALGLRNPSILSRVATRRLGLLRKGSSRLAVPKQEGREHTGLGSNSQGWRARRHLNSVVGKRSVYLESVLARLTYRLLCKTQQQALNRRAKTALNLIASLISRRSLPRVKLVGNPAA